APGDRDVPDAVGYTVFAPGGRAEARAAALDDREVKAVLGTSWQVRRLGGERGPITLEGSPFSLEGGSNERSVRALLSKLPGLFGDAAAEANLELVYDRSSGPSGTLRMRQLFEGARVEGAEIDAR